jgi:hypothetical protein
MVSELFSSYFFPSAASEAVSEGRVPIMYMAAPV